MNNKLLSIRSALILSLAISIGLVGCKKDDVPTAEIIIDVPTINLPDNKLRTADVDIHVNLPWTVAVVDDAGAAPSWFYVDDLSGNAGVRTLTITVTEPNPSYDNTRKGYINISAGNYMSTITVVQPVKSSVIEVEKVIIEGDPSHEIRKDAEITLVAVVVPDNATNKDIVWSSDKPNVATVDETGKVIGHAYGLANITAKSVSGAKMSSCAINVMQYQIGDYYPDPNVRFSSPGVVESGTMPIGIVITVTNFGKNGKMASLDEALLSWGPKGVIVGLQTESDGVKNNDGFINTAKIKNEHNIDDYPAFKWCVDKTTGSKSWYLPSLAEVFSLYDLFNKDRAGFITKSQQAGGAGIMEGDPWYSPSNEATDAANYAFGVSFGDRYAGHLGKADGPHKVRAFTKF